MARYRVNSYRKGKENFMIYGKPGPGSLPSLILTSWKNISLLLSQEVRSCVCVQ